MINQPDICFENVNLKMAASEDEMKCVQVNHELYVIFKNIKINNL